MKNLLPKIKYIDRIGVEIEGLWHKDIDNTVLRKKLHRLKGWTRNYDSFIQSDGSISIGNSNPDYDDYEITTPPLDLRNTLKAISMITKFLKHTNDTCGFHIHASFKDTNNYLKLTQPDFMTSFVKVMTKTFPETKIRTTNNFCRGTYDTGQEVSTIERQFIDTYKERTRYKAVNFCYGLHKTVEFRLFPAMQWMSDKDIFSKYVLETVGFIEHYLNSMPSKNILVEKISTTDNLYNPEPLKVLQPITINESN